jgi:hypothetical protein
LALLATACASRPEGYIVGFVGFDGREEPANEATSTWSDAVGTRLQFDVLFESDCSVEPGPSYICVTLTDSEPADLPDSEQYAGYTRRRDVWVNRAMDRAYPDELPHTLEHELGHAMGLQHRGGDVVMNPECCDQGSFDVAPGDVTQYLELR